MKVAQLAGYCAEVSNYHHGEQCLYDTIIKMAQDFVGSNNIPYFEKDGQFGSRTFAGKDAASARYIFTKCAKFTRMLFPEEDDQLLDYTFDDGDQVEPDYYLPILPTILINGCTAGIGTGWSCSVPCYNIRQLGDKIKEWLTTENVSDLNLIPYYNNFKGQITILENNKYQTTGIFNEISNGKKKGKLFEITELPIGLWTNKYKEELETMLENKKLKSLKNYSTSDNIHFIIEPNDDFTPTMENMKLLTQISNTNMVLFTDTNKLKKFNTIQEIFEIYCKKRLELYEKRKKFILKNLKINISIQKNKKRFIEEVEDETLKIFRIKEEIIIQSLIDKKYDKDPKCVSDEHSKGYQYLLSIPMRDLCLEKINELSDKIVQLENKMKHIQQTTPQQMWIQELDAFFNLYEK
jgi:DNA topoisomerase-2